MTTAAAHTATRPGEIHRWRHSLIPTSREAPADAKLRSHVMLLRAGCVRQVTAGVYTYLPLGLRVLRKISDIVREEMNAAGAAELLMPCVAPLDLLEKTGRAEDYGDLLFRLADRHGRATYLAPTHEEVITDMLIGTLTSYKQLPLSLYQIQTKYRDEFRPRGGLLRGREFLMKDAYSFHDAVEGEGGLNATYDAMYRAYTNIFTRCGLDFTAVEAEAGPIGGSASHEFMVNAETGEDTILVCPETGYAANVEKCEIGERFWSFDAPEAPDECETRHTPNMPGIEGVAEHLGVKPGEMLKTLVFEPKAVGEDGAPLQVETGPFAGKAVRWVLACVRGDHDVNEGKVRDATGFAVRLAPDRAAKAAGLAIGYVSPRAARREDTILLIDPDAAQPRLWATGADKPDHHDINFTWRRDASDIVADARTAVRDLRNAQAGDPSPRSESARLEARRGVEVGHIFKLGTKYSEPMGLKVMNREQRLEPVVMGCYGIGVSRTLQACVEMSCDGDGIVWPVPLAPYHTHIALLDPDDAALLEAADSLAAALAARGFDVLIDDRAERPGVKFKDADLIGLPVRVTIGRKAMQDGNVEIVARAGERQKQVLPIADAAERIIALLGSA